MKILGIETSTNVCGAALIDNGKILAEKYLTEPHIHSEKLIHLVDSVLQSDKSYDALAISIGPGSFTGLRIGLSVVKGLAYASLKPVFAVSTLEALSYNLVFHERMSDGTVICPLIDARRDEFYTAVYKVAAGELINILEPQARKFDEIVKIAQMREIHFIGDGSQKFINFCKEKKIIKNLWIFYDGIINLCSASSVAFLGEKKSSHGKTADIQNLEPMYIKDFQALAASQH
jgi:tRNA threonylcarbamoyladenosine biosynthesis protein TsaB